MATWIDIIRRMTAKIRNIRRLSNSLFGKQYLLGLHILYTNTFRIIKIHIEEIHMAVLGITQHELVSSPEFPCTARHIACITGDGVRAPDAVFFAALFLNRIDFECLPRCGGVSKTHDIFHNKCKRPNHTTLNFITIHRN